MTTRTTRIKSLGKLVPFFAFLTLAGCSTGILSPDRVDYKSASKKEAATPSLDVPPDLSQISRDNRYSIPDSKTGTLTASALANKGQTAPVAAIATANAPETVAINKLDGMRVEREGSERWLLVPNQTPEVLWPKLKKFWEDSGFTIKDESMATGVMETDWAENRAKIPDDFIRRTIGYVFDNLYSTGERDKYRTRLERRADGSTEVYITHRGVEEVLVGEQKDSTKWQARPNDPSLESVFLTRFMVSLGSPQDKAKELTANPVEVASSAHLVKDDGKSRIDIDETFEHAWRRVGLALDRVGFTVEDRDRNKGIYFVRYVDQDAKDPNESWLSRIFSFEKDKEAKRFRVAVVGDAAVSHVSVQNNDGGADNSEASEKILNLLMEQLK